VASEVQPAYVAPAVSNTVLVCCCWFWHNCETEGLLQLKLVEGCCCCRSGCCTLAFKGCSGCCLVLTLLLLLLLLLLLQFGPEEWLAMAEGSAAGKNVADFYRLGCGPFLILPR
jgi:hypothetical protein